MRPGFEEEESVDEGIIKIEYDIESFFLLTHNVGIQGKDRKFILHSQM